MHALKSQRQISTPFTCILKILLSQKAIFSPLRCSRLQEDHQSACYRLTDGKPDTKHKNDTGSGHGSDIAADPGNFRRPVRCQKIRPTTSQPDPKGSWHRAPYQLVSIEQNKAKTGYLPKSPSRKASGARHLHLALPPNRTNPNPSGSRISRNSGRSSSGSIFRRQPAAPEQNKPKPLRQPQIAQLRPKLLWINPSSPAYGTRTEQTQTPPAKIQAKPKSIKKRIVNHLISPAQNKPKPPSRPQKYLRKRTERSRHQSLKFALTARVSGQTTPRMFFDISESA